MDIAHYVTTKDAAAIIGCTPSWIIDQCQAGVIPGAVKFGSCWMIPRSWAEDTPAPKRGRKHRIHPIPVLGEEKKYKYIDERKDHVPKTGRKRAQNFDLTGQVFGRWTVLGKAENRNGRV